MALLCLAMFIALIFESGKDEPGSTLQLDIPTEHIAEQNSSAGESTIARDGSNTAVFAAEPRAIPSGMITSLEQAAEEPLDVELSRLLDAIQQGFGESSAQIAPTLRPYAYRLAGRMNIRQGAFRIRVAAPNEDLAVARAEVLARLFESAGVASNRLTFMPRSGIHSLTAEAA